MRLRGFHPMFTKGASVVGIGGRVPAFPVWETANDKLGQGNGANFTATYPANIVAGDGILILLSTNNSAEWTVPAQFDDGSGGWTMNFQRFRWAYRIADGTETGTFTVVLSSTQYRAWRLIRISGVHPTQFAEQDDGASANSTSANAPATTATWGVAKNLFLACYSIGNTTISSYPTNYVNGRLNGTTEALAIASRDVEAATEDPGVATLAASATWTAQTLVVRPA